MNADGCTSRFRCVQCGFPIDTLYIQYSPGNIRLMKCEYCKAVADEYIECEVMILIIDLILHKPKAYRHLFYNRFSKETVNFEGLLWKSILALLILDIYRMWVLRMNENEWTLPVTADSFLLDFGKMFTGVVLENLIFFCCDDSWHWRVAGCICESFWVERGIAYTHHFKLLQDLSHGHDGMEVPVLGDFYH